MVTRRCHGIRWLPGSLRADRETCAAVFLRAADRRSVGQPGISGSASLPSNTSDSCQAEIAIPVSVQALQCGGDPRQPGVPFTLRLENGTDMRARSVVVASGARYRQIDIENLAMFEGAGVS